MEKKYFDQGVERLQRQIARIGDLRQLTWDSVEFKTWKRDTEVVIEKTFGPNTRNLRDFSRIPYTPRMIGWRTTDEERHAAFLDGLALAESLLNSLVKELLEYGSGNESAPPPTLESRLRRFHLVARQLRDRRSGRPPLLMDDEYDVQYLLHALLHLDFNDIRPEEWTPSYAGGSSRMDFLVKDADTVVETKKARAGRGAREIGDELIVDIGRYRAHPNCRTLICLVYDPDAEIRNPTALETDLSRSGEGLVVQVLVVPKGS